MSVRRLVSLSLLLILALGPAAGRARAATAHVASAQVDLAAMALSPVDIPDGFFDTYEGWWVPADAISDAVLNGVALPPGLERAYQTFYATPDGAAIIHVFLLEFATPTQARSGATAVDAALRPPSLPDGSTTEPIHAPGPAVGEEPHTLTAVTFDTRAAGGPLVDVVAASFRHDRLIAGISIERYTESPAPGTPAASAASAASVASPASVSPEQEQLAVSLAGTLESRITTVLAGRAPAGVDSSLAEAVLPLGQLVGSSTPVLGGYKAGIDFLRCGVCGEQNTLLRFADTAQGAFVRAAVFGPLVDGEPQPPYVGIAVSSFASMEDAQAVLEATRQSPNDLPTVFPVSRGARTLADIPAIPGAAAVAAFHGTSHADDPNASADSAAVYLVVGNRLATINVLGGLTSDEAMAAAVDLATQQAACLSAGGTCSTVHLPESLAGLSTARGAAPETAARLWRAPGLRVPAGDTRTPLSTRAQAGMSGSRVDEVPVMVPQR